MRYYYFNPISKQYYFPEGFHKYPLFLTFYKPYKLTAKLMWKIWINSTLFRLLLNTNQPDKYIPLEHTKKYVSPNSILAFNLGTKGIDQKITIISVDTKTKCPYFLKYATSEVACENVLNEGIVLQQISELPFVPKLKLLVQEENNFTLIKTTILKGVKIKYLEINDRILEILYTLSTLKVKSKRNYTTNLLSCFAHGDFCPWNILIDNGKLKLFDWELAGNYPIGYDLFTYIFQYEFLVNRTSKIENILKLNSNVIQEYFNHFEIKEWIPYLKEFAELKEEIELKKNNYYLIETYLNIKQYIINQFH